MNKLAKTLIIILGPTASGKTSLAIDIAKYFKTEIISADSRQFYHEIPIGTAAPDINQLAECKHHFIGHLSIEENYNVSRYEKDVIELLELKFKTHDIIVMVGGSGLYINAVCDGIDDLPDPDEKIRQKLNDLYNENGLPALNTKLELLDPEYHATVDKSNPKRLIRAIEVCLQTGKTYTELRKNQSINRDFHIVKIGLELPRATLNERIHQRTDEMIQQGWLEEAESVFRFRELNALNTVGFKELFAYLDGSLGLEKAIEKIKTNTRRFAKRQMTWFRKDKEINWFSPDNTKEILNYLSAKIK